MPDAEIPAELWAIRFGEHWHGIHGDITVTEEARARLYARCHGGEAVLIGVNPERLAKCEAENERLRRTIADLEADNTRFRVQAVDLREQVLNLQNRLTDTEHRSGCF